jgi:uncharacterized protein (DUF2345 family)
MPEWIKNAVYPAIGILTLTGIYTILDARHEKVGEVKRAEIRALSREIRDKQEQLEIAPDARYAPARRKEIARLKQEVKELERDLE